MKKSIILVMLALICLSSVAVAGVNYKQFKVDAVDRGLQIVMDGKAQAFSSAPLIINGQVMVPLRDAAQILGKQISWEAGSNKIFIGQNILPKPTAPKVAEEVKYIEDMTVIRNVGPFYEPKRAIAAAGKTYQHGVVVDLDPAKPALQVPTSRIVADTKLLLNGNYSKMEGYVAVEDGSMNSNKGFVVRFSGDNVPIYESPVIHPAELATFLSSTKLGKLDNVKVLKIEIELMGEEIPGNTSVTKAALANFKFYRKAVK